MPAPALGRAVVEPFELCGGIGGGGTLRCEVVAGRRGCRVRRGVSPAQRSLGTLANAARYRPSIGFGATVIDPEDRRTGKVLAGCEPEDLVKFGLIPEFIGRLPVIATLEDLDEAALIQILTEPKNALLKQYQRLFEMENVTLTFTDDALAAVARRAIQRKTGARGLRSIMEGILLDTMFDLPSLEGVEEVVISEEVVNNKEARPLYIYSERKKEELPAASA